MASTPLLDGTFKSIEPPNQHRTEMTEHDRSSFCSVHCQEIVENAHPLHESLAAASSFLQHCPIGGPLEQLVDLPETHTILAVSNICLPHGMNGGGVKTSGERGHNPTTHGDDKCSGY